MASVSKGAFGEVIAARFLREKGFVIVSSNYRCRQGEVDIIATQGNYIVFVEVKTRSGEHYGTAAEAVTWSKQQKIRQTALQYLNEYRKPFAGVEFQVVEVLLRQHDGLDFQGV
jgi:putative endonuclease